MTTARRGRGSPLIRVRAAASAALALALTLPLVPAAAREAPWSGPDTTLQRMDAAHAPTLSEAGRDLDPVVIATQETQRPENQCFGDPDGDTWRFANPPVPADFPRVDIHEHCVRFGPTLSLTIDVEQPTSPRSDPNWDGATFVGWFIDINNDKQGDFFVSYHLDENGVLIGEVKDIRVAGKEPVTCIAAATYTGIYAVSDIGTECIGLARTIRVSPATWYDTTPTDGADGVEYFDVAPNDQDTRKFDGPVIGGDDRPTERLGGDTRVETAVLISQEQFPDGPVDAVFIARSDVFADAVTGGVLTAGPILLVPSCGPIPQAVLDEIERLDPAEVIALGQEAAVCDEMLDQAAAGRTPGRIGGADRIETSVGISQFQFPDPGDALFVFLARADIFADAVVGGVLTDGPIILIPSCGGVPQVVHDEIARLDPDSVVALGGEVAVCPDSLDEAADGRRQRRLAGPSRIETAIAISRWQFPAGAAKVYLARDGRPSEPGGADNLFADAAVGGILTAGPILLVPTCGDLPAPVGSEVSRIGPLVVVALGGTAAICEDMLTQASEH